MCVRVCDAVEMPPVMVSHFHFLNLCVRSTQPEKSEVTFLSDFITYVFTYTFFFFFFSILPMNFCARVCIFMSR